ncbi:hypothetical protein [Candidatus Poriferisocius sp.]|uniref:hypothetical protein n=1 Tax=Candidatus Poriferisocius sp. TaxID=3101276 RepID=UPI003B59C78C
MGALRCRGLGVLTAAMMVAAGCGTSGGGDAVSCVSSLGNDKFCLVADPAGGGGGLKRVRALRDITVVVDGQPVLVAQRGDLGGWIEGEENLSAGGSAWVAGDAKVFGDARVEDDALVTDLAEVSDGAVVRDRGLVSGHAKVFGAAQVSDQAQVVDAAVACWGAEVFGNAVVGDEAVVCGRVPRAFSPAAWAGAGKGAKTARMFGWVQGWSEMGMEPVRQRAGLGGTGAHVFGDAAVSDGAWVFEQAKVFGEAEISGQARVYEYAQVLDDSRVYDKARVSGRALVFGLSSSKYFVDRSSHHSESFVPIFEPDDYAVRLWTDSYYPPNTWLVRTSVFAEFDGVQDLDPFVNPHFDARTRSYWNPNKFGIEEPAPTMVSGFVNVTGSARVWSGSQLSGDVRVFESARVSGGSTVDGGILCADIWLNSSRNVATRGQCDWAGS